jgi:hypothetical protein
MAKEKKSISITISDIDDISKVLIAVEKLFSQLMSYYLTKDKLDLFETLIYAGFSYFGLIVKRFEELKDKFGEELDE